jgi:hypothetical protein
MKVDVSDEDRQNNCGPELHTTPGEWCVEHGEYLSAIVVYDHNTDEVREVVASGLYPDDAEWIVACRKRFPKL